MQRFELRRRVVVVLCVLFSGAAASAQVNDNCAGAVALAAGANGPFSNALASNSATLASCGGGGYKDIWFKFTTAIQGTLTVSTGCGGFDTVLTAYGACGGAELACNDDTPGCGFGGSTITLLVGPASTYYLRVASYTSGTAGTFTITVTPSTNDACSGAIALAYGTNGPFSNAGATNSGVAATCTAPQSTGYHDVWFTVGTGAAGTITASTGCGGFDTVLTAYNACAGTQLACNDDTLNCGPGGSTITFLAAASSTYYIRVASYISGTSGSFTITVTIALPPANDNCPGAIGLSYGPNGPFSNAGATNSGVAATCAGGSPGYHDVWFSVVAAAAGTLTVSTGCILIGFDTVLTAYDACGGTELACNDDTPGCGGSTIVFPATAASTYYCRVASWAGTPIAGSFSITVTVGIPPANDECTGAIALAYGTNGPFSNADATDGGVAASCGLGGHKDVWFSVVATCTGSLSVSTGCGGFDTVLTAYDACGGAELACNGDTPGCVPGGSTIAFPATAGATYYIRVAAASPVQTGSFTIDVAPPAQVGLVFTSPLGPGSLRVDISSRQLSGIYVMAVTFNAGNYPSGWFYGIDIAWTELIGEINGGYPFVGTLGSCGETTIGPFAGLGAVAGIPFYAVAFATQVGAAVPDVSAAVTASIP